MTISNKGKLKRRHLYKTGVIYIDKLTFSSLPTLKEMRTTVGLNDFFRVTRKLLTLEQPSRVLKVLVLKIVIFKYHKSKVVSGDIFFIGSEM